MTAPLLERDLREPAESPEIQSGDGVAFDELEGEARGLPPPVDLVLPADPRVRDLRVTPHALSAYDTLLTPLPPEEEMPDGATH